MTDRLAAAALLAAARAWADDDPDPTTAAEIRDLIDRCEQADQCEQADPGDHADPAASAVFVELADRFSGMLEFGTAGLRGALGGGPNRMNRAVVIRAAAGLTAYLQTTATGGAVGGALGGPTVVIGYDARHNSDVFARDTAAVVAAAGGRALVLPRPLPTPVLAFAIRHLGADAGVMVTASHNPAQDNGYKVYLGDGSQIVPPADAEIAARIAEVASVAAVPLADDGWSVLGDDLLENYVDAMASVIDSDSPRDLAVVHTSLHGVGDRTLRAAFRRAGFAEPIVVAGQADPDPEFPTVTFPNPEEAGAIDAALDLARQVHPDLVIANDPDADRCAAAVFDPALHPATGDWRMLRGDELGALLGHHILARGVPADAVVANSIVSSRLLARMAAAAGVRHTETLTGFKWIGRVPALAYGYEEALGYCVAPHLVRDKDGISAALVLAELAATLRRDGRTLLDVLDDLAAAHGVHATDSFSVRVADPALIGPVIHRLRSEVPRAVGGVPVARVDDLARGDGGLPPTEGLRWFLADDTRVIVRPSGTEPKLKVYLEVIEAVAPAEPVGAARLRSAARLAAVRTDLEALTRTG